MAVAADGEIDEPRPLAGQLFGTQPVLVHDAWAIALAEDVGVPDELLDRRHVLRVVEIEKTAPLAVARVHDMLRHLGQGRPAARVERAVQRLLDEGKVLTRDLGGRATTVQVAERIAALL
jgi:hypothetical protein